MSQSDSKKDGFYRTRRELDLEEKKRRREALPIKHDKYWNPEDHTLTNTQIAALESIGCERHKILLRCKNTLLNLNRKGMPNKFKKIEVYFKYQRDRKIFTINFLEPTYPERFNCIGLDAPPLLHFKGNGQLLYSPDTFCLHCLREEDSIEAIDLRDPHKDVLVAYIDNRCDYLAAARFVANGGHVIALTQYDVDYAIKHHASLCEKILETSGVVISSVARGLTPCMANDVQKLQIALSETIENVSIGTTLTHKDFPFDALNDFNWPSNSENTSNNLFSNLYYSGELDDIENDE